MKKIFIYYSLSGNGDLIAENLKEKGYDIRKVIPKKELPKPFFLRIMSGGFKAMINAKDKLVDFDNNIEKYDEVVIGSPIWNGRLSSPINSVLAKINLENKKVSFILYSGSGNEDTKAASLIKEKYNAPIINLQEPLKNKKELNKIKDK
jgi:flavorubredoxin